MDDEPNSMRHLLSGQAVIAELEVSPGPWWGFNGVKHLYLLEDGKVIRTSKSAWQILGFSDGRSVKVVPIIGLQLVFVRWAGRNRRALVLHEGNGKEVKYSVSNWGLAEKFLAVYTKTKK